MRGLQAKMLACAGAAMFGFSSHVWACGDNHGLIHSCLPHEMTSSDGISYGGAPQSLQGGGVFNVSIANFAFSAPDVIIGRDMSVRWTNNDIAPHTSTSQAAPDSGLPDGVWNSGNLANGGTFERIFDATDLFYYFCNVHGTFMQGSIDVRNPADASGDGLVDFTDLLTLAQHYNLPSPEPATAYAFGDFDFSGLVDFNDLLLVAQNYGGEPALTGLDARFRHDFQFALASVPEPSTVVGLIGLGMILLGRRR